ncbi:gluconate 2-dehydrogenase subunit 3 family protein [Arthrobacter sp. H14-L1]|uniref:gluconate 2-dehydrogenase subunit 3 family protein n=1 Tax=Arthrobacter sp. H14-L1 TaxID=2996697 RepID=UPI00226D9CE5|nr:gluconate 2-dehydrogenase subunit 3 family protein [Arthrobacter sp. H14-L1]MCY0906035.1 gluconate 2-dehydrogenase subunit 3 family protein [Arthrobacter sp. H14-L1]
MSRLPLDPSAGGGRFPGFDVMAQSKHWDEVTTSVVVSRLGMPPDIRFFRGTEEATASALCDQLLDQQKPPRVPVVNMVDARLADEQTDGWHYDGMAPDGQSWRDSLAALDEDAMAHSGCTFAEAPWEAQSAILQAVLDLGSKPWHGTPAARIWSLWTRYACTAFYSHPWAWDEIGFPGPAYPRGYKNLGVNEPGGKTNRLEPFEVADARPAQDPLRKGNS